MDLFGVDDWAECERFEWCIGHRVGVDAAVHSGTAAVYVDEADADGLQLDVEVDADGWAVLTLDVGEWVAEGPGALDELDRLAGIVARARADAVRVLDGLTMHM